MSTDADRGTNPLLDDAIVAYVGRGSHKIPTADEAAVLALDSEHGDELLRDVKRALAVSDQIVVDGPASSEVKRAATEAHRESLPELGDGAVEALVWRWGFIRFHG
ncbi:hypothetical protein FBY40_0858 [Microbacterium sp. SLBN-154]|uniref:hypothetical protein n=1 Tax=Microbacterium sp. SLBN-154 TaxID=2768458 RepID=UPI00115089D8|nr:hypothetical protein [Microbacterium sp. SLBN-154]TQK18371.1 hypothetical protein FBY40_0858 [Microbacterium sp. SLBN-154]